MFACKVDAVVGPIIAIKQAVGIIIRIGAGFFCQAGLMISLTTAAGAVTYAGAVAEFEAFGRAIGRGAIAGNGADVNIWNFWGRSSAAFDIRRTTRAG